ncbi:hypothetical protein ACJJIF_04925 [Microbulbifer sp. SSSA002]|uniref:hypothetical protein n=1 Tax=Microbulbifer sp. SSSA002 TaxID=3243376 RepID=UPI004039B6B8
MSLNRKLPLALQTAIENAYDTFARYSQLAHIEGCPCCVSEADNKILTSVPLHEISSEKLEKYSRKAMTTWGGVEDFKHFLPRMLELIATNAKAMDCETIAGKLVYADWQLWPEPERNAVNLFLNQWWQSERRKDAHSAMSCLSSLFCAELDVSRYLDEWWNDDTPLSRRCIVDFLASYSYELTQGGSSLAFWPNGFETIGIWLRKEVEISSLLSLALKQPIGTDVYGLYEIASMLLGRDAADSWFQKYQERHQEKS